MTTDYPPSHHLLRRSARGGDVPVDYVTLGYDDRFLRRKRLVCGSGQGVMVNLAETTSIEAGDCLVLLDDRLIEVRAAHEPVLIVTGGHLARLAWHIGNRHTPCQVEETRLVIRADHVLEAMLRQLGADVVPALEPFNPEGGAYGHGRTLGHDHGTASFAQPGLALTAGLPGWTPGT